MPDDPHVPNDPKGEPIPFAPLEDEAATAAPTGRDAEDANIAYMEEHGCFPWQEPDKKPPPPTDLAAWLDAELTQDVGAALSRPVVDAIRDADPADRIRLEKVLKKYGVLTAVRKRLKPSPQHSAEIPPLALSDGLASTDQGNAERILAVHGEDLIWCEAAASWYLWDHKRWLPDQIGTVRQMSKVELAKIQTLVAGAQGPTEVQAVRQWARTSESFSGLQAALRMASSAVSRHPDAFDSDPDLLNTPTGTLDLTTGTSRPATREDLITKLTAAPFDPEAECPRWLQFIREVTGGDTKLAMYLQVAAGYSISASTDEQCFFLCHGSGANGKSTFLETISYVLGDYAKTAAMSAFVDHKGQTAGDLVMLRGARFVAASESKKGARLAIEVLKRFTGKESVTARKLYENEVTFTPVCKIWLALNDLPRIEATDHGTWRRVRLIPWKVKFDDPKRRDAKLDEKLRAEAPGILRWLVEGYKAWRKVGALPSPGAVLEATADYKDGEDLIGQWLEDRWVVGKGGYMSGKLLYEDYEYWCEKVGCKPVGVRRFTPDVEAHGVEKHRSSSERGWNGITRRVEGETAEPTKPAKEGDS